MSNASFAEKKKKDDGKKNTKPKGGKSKKKDKKRSGQNQNTGTKQGEGKFSWGPSGRARGWRGPHMGVIKEKDNVPGKEAAAEANEPYFLGMWDNRGRLVYRAGPDGDGIVYGHGTEDAVYVPKDIREKPTKSGRP